MTKLCVKCHRDRQQMDDVRCKKEEGSPSTPSTGSVEPGSGEPDSGTSETVYSVPEEEPMMAAETPDIKK